MRDFRKFCRPKFTKIPKLGDVVVKLKCGEIKAMTQDEYIKVQRFFNIYSFVGESSNSSGNIVVVNKETGKKAVFSSDDYDSIKDEFDIVDIIGNKLNPFNNHEYIDLGLPSGTLWATMNVGATSEGELGDYYKFGETTVYDGTDYNTSAYDLAEDLSLENDAANVNWSGDWHIPTKSLWDELISNTTHTYISDYNSTGVNVIKFAKTNDSSTFIILPVGGSYTDGELTNSDTAYYWSNTLYYKSAYYAVFTLNSYFHIDWKTAYGHGFLVRPVCDSINSLKLAQEGDIICHNNVLNQDAIFSFNDWLNLNDSWDAIDLYGIETFDDDDEVTEERYVILSNGTTFIIKAEDYSLVSSHWEIVDTIIPSHNYPQNYLTFVTTESGTFKFNGNSINYSLDNGNTWASLASNTDSPTVSAGSKIMWKATGLTPTSSIGIGTFSSSDNFTVEGNVMSLLYGDDFVGQTSLSGNDYAFFRLFNGCTGLISAENLSLPATTLTDYCYGSMFSGCTSLTTAPSLPATTLVNSCYSYMFYNCTSLTTASQLPATTLADFCYYQMFRDCTSLTTAPSLPATTLVNSCYEQMFRGCSSLTTAPSLPATTLVNYCYSHMFYNCTGINSITCLATNISASNCTTNWVSGVASSGTFTKAASMSNWTTSVNGIPNEWIVVDI